MFNENSAINKDALSLMHVPDSMGGGYFPIVFTSARDEMLACRTGAWLGVSLCCSPICDISGPDAVKMLNYICVNRDFGRLKIGGSRHVLMCNDKGQLLADGVLFKKNDEVFRTYWLSPMLEYYATTLGFDVKYEYITDEFTFQIDGPRSLEIMEAAAQCDIHDLQFAQNKMISIKGIPVKIHRLGMSGCLAYEMHGAASEADKVYTAILEAGKDFGIRRQGYSQYSYNHTPGGYPNQMIHFWYPFLTSGDQLKNWIEQCETIPDYWKVPCFAGSAAYDPENGYVTPYDINWDYLINYDHDFIGKAALEEIKKDPPRAVVTLEWDLDDVAAAYAYEVALPDMYPFDDIATDGDGGKVPLIISKVMDGDKMIGTASARVRSFYDKKILSLAFISNEYAVEGKKLDVIWGTNPETQSRIKATVAKFPYYDGEYRNETCDVNKLIPKRF
ncbi:MAG: aminomethyl transferase family protein [Eubacteriaceae bacterium]|jgi:glycine cleavage system aminomethyltransferase T|nr:aminomethyl transferase family protein [Eubacteriaceae bacterium]